MRADTIGIILLAAGESGRLGEPKQLLLFQDETLLRRAAKTALAVSSRVVVTLGSRIELMHREIEDLPVQTAENKDWAEGMSGSIRIGLDKLLVRAEKINAVIVMVCDQPFVDAGLLEKIINKSAEKEVLIVACQYQETLGVPALFHRRLFPELVALDSAGGAKRLIKKYREQTAIVRFPEGAFDIDTPEDYENLKLSQK